MYTVSGRCHCGNIRVDLKLTRQLSQYSPRACDCSFCTKHRAAYISDPEGSLMVRFEDPGKVGRYRQGSETAEMLLCRNCGVLLGALFHDGVRDYATINARVLDGAIACGTDQIVSPQTLSQSEKTDRWRRIWFSDVVLAVSVTSSGTSSS